MKIITKRISTIPCPVFHRGRHGNATVYQVEIEGGSEPDPLIIQAPRKWILQDVIRFVESGEWSGQDDHLMDEFGESTFGDKAYESGHLDSRHWQQL